MILEQSFKILRCVAVSLLISNFFYSEYVCHFTNFLHNIHNRWESMLLILTAATLHSIENHFNSHPLAIKIFIWMILRRRQSFCWNSCFLWLLFSFPDSSALFGQAPQFWGPARVLSFPTLEGKQSFPSLFDAGEEVSLFGRWCAAFHKAGCPPQLGVIFGYFITDFIFVILINLIWFCSILTFNTS